MTNPNEKSPAPEQASEAANSGAGPVREAIVSARAAGGNGTSSKVSRADALPAEQRSAIDDAARVLEQNWEHATADRLRDAFAIEAKAAQQATSQADWRGDFERQAGAVGFDISREEFGGEYCHPNAADAFRWYYAGRLDQACTGGPVEQHEAAPAGWMLVPVKITDEMIEAAIESHYGKLRVRRQGGAAGVIMTVNERDWSGIDAMRRFWKGALSAVPQPPAQPEPAVADERAAQDGERFRWLTTDHDDAGERAKCREILSRLSVMSYSAACRDIDIARASSPNAAGAEGAMRGTPAQIEHERKLTCEAIDGAIAFGYQNTNPPPDDAHWIATYWRMGQKLAQLDALPASARYPTAWVRFRSDGGFEGPIMDTDERMCDVRRKSGAWSPLFLGPAQAAEPVAWRELARRLYVELFHCDQQMRSTRDENGEPHWTQSSVVRDVLADAKTALEASPPPPAPASARPTDDELWDQTLRERDEYHETADKLAAAIAKHFGVDIGEHSNANCPWDEALEVIENAAPASAPVGLTDALRQAREELSQVEWENDPPARVTNLFSTIDALLEGAKK